MPTVLELFGKIQSSVFPERIPRNLVCRTKDWLGMVLVELQEKVPLLRQQNQTIVPYLDTGYACGVSYFRVPRGLVTAVSTYVPGAECDRIQAIKRDAVDFDCRVVVGLGCGTPPVAVNPVPFNQNPLLYRPDASLDPVIPVGNRTVNRAQNGWARLYPRLASTEVVEIEWTGKIQDWGDGTNIPASWLTDVGSLKLEIYDAIERYMKYRKIESSDCDATKARMARETYDEKIRYLISALREEHEFASTPAAVC